LYSHRGCRLLNVANVAELFINIFFGPSHFCFQLFFFCSSSPTLFVALSRTLPPFTPISLPLAIYTVTFKSLLFISQYVILHCCNSFIFLSLSLSTSCFPSYLFPLQHHFLRLHSYHTLLTFRRLTSTIVDVPHRSPPKLHFIYLFNKYRYRIF